MIKNVLSALIFFFLFAFNASAQTSAVINNTIHTEVETKSDGAAETPIICLAACPFSAIQDITSPYNFLNNIQTHTRMRTGCCWGFCRQFFRPLSEFVSDPDYNLMKYIL